MIKAIADGLLLFREQQKQLVVLGKRRASQSLCEIDKKKESEVCKTEEALTSFSLSFLE